MSKLIDDIFAAGAKIASTINPRVKSVTQALTEAISEKNLNSIKSGAYIFEGILNRADDKQINLKRLGALQWLQLATSSLKESPDQILNENQPKTMMNRSQIVGNMFMFRYSAKTKATLPYWDRYPVIFPITVLPDGFIGINFHYLEPRLRAVLLDALYSLKRTSLNGRVKLILTYSILKGASKFRFFKPCVKRYLNSNIQSKLLPIDPKYWPMAIFIPVQRFQGASNQTVYADSNNKIYRKRK